MAIVVAINIKKDEKRVSVKKAYFSLEDNEKNRGVTILLSDTKEKNTLFMESYNGICIAKFCENITISGSKIDDFNIGDEIVLGELVLKIEKVGKSCYNDCELFNKKGKCFLAKEVIFAKVVKAGFAEVSEF